jgi:hypothetical protein
MLLKIKHIYLSHNFLLFCINDLYHFVPQNFKAKIRNYETNRKSIFNDASFHLFFF